MGNEVSDCKCIRKHNALEPPILPENVGQEPMIATRRHVVQVHIGTHNSTSPSLNRCMKRNQVNIAKQFLRHIGRVIVTAAVGCTVTSKMLYGHQYAVLSKLRTLESPDLCLSHCGTENWILSGTFHDATPPSVTRNIDHRRKSPINPGSACILCRQMLCLLLDRWIPGRCHRQRYWKDSSISMNHIKTKEDWNMKTRLFDRDMLKAIDLLDVHLPKNRAYSAFGNEIIRFLFSEARNHETGRFIELTDLFVESHLLQERLGLLFGLSTEGTCLCPGGNDTKECDPKKSDCGIPLQHHDLRPPFLKIDRLLCCDDVGHYAAARFMP